MIAEISAGLSSLNAAVSLIKGLDAAKTQVAINEVKLDLHQRLFEAQQALLTAQAADTSSAERIRNLEEEIVRLENWEGQKERYEPKAIGYGAFAYALQAGMENGEPPHWLCTGCFDKRQRSILQTRGQEVQDHTRRVYLAKWGCNVCGAEVLVDCGCSPLSPDDK